MALVLPDVAEVLVLKAILNHTAAPGNVVLRLYSNNITPGESDVAGTYTECSGNGYAAKTLTGSSWTVTTSSGTTEASYAAQTFTFTGALGNVYGYYVTDSNGVLLWSERFSSAPFNVQNNGDAITITPKIQLA